MHLPGAVLQPPRASFEQTPTAPVAMAAEGGLAEQHERSLQALFVEIKCALRRRRLQRRAPPTLPVSREVLRRLSAFSRGWAAAALRPPAGRPSPALTGSPRQVRAPSGGPRSGPRGCLAAAQGAGRQDDGVQTVRARRCASPARRPARLGRTIPPLNGRVRRRNRAEPPRAA